MDMLDLFAESGLEWVYDRVEERYGRVVGWVVTMTLGIVMVAALIGALAVIF